MSIFGDTDFQQARELALTDVATAKPTGFMENAAAAWKEFSTNDALGALDSRRRAAYDERISQVQKITGEKLDNPLPIANNNIGIKNPIDIVYGMFSDDDGAAEMQRMNDHEQRINQLRERLGPDERGLIPTQQQIMERLKAESKQAEKETADIAGRATIPGMLGGMAGGSAASLTQPEMLITLPLGASVRLGLMAKMMAETAIAAGSQAAFEPAVQSQRAELGLESGVGPALENIGMAGLGAGVLTGALGGAGALLGLATRGGVTAFERAARRPATADERALITAVQQDVVMENTTPYRTKDADTYAVKQQNENAAYEAALASRPLAESDLVTSDALVKTILETDRPTIQTLRNKDLADIGTDAKLMQYKAGGDDAGVTERLQGVTEWHPERAGIAAIYEFEDGRRIIADGHQRLGLAKKLAAEGQEIELPAVTWREADGVSIAQARARAAFINIAQGSGTATDAAKILRETGRTARELALPPKSAMVRDAEGLTNLDDDVFGMVVNDVLSEQFGGIIGRLVRDPQLQPSIAGLLVKLKPANAVEADSIVRQALDAGATRETQASLFGDEVVSESLYLERARVLDRGLKMLRRNVDTFRTLTERGEDIVGEGNVLNPDANANRLDIERALQQYISAQAHRKGMIGDALTKAARTAKETGRYSDAAREFVGAISDAAKRGEIDGRSVSGSRTDLEPQYEGGEAPTFVDASTAQQVDDATLDMFDDPASPATEKQSLQIANEIQQAVVDQDRAPPLEFPSKERFTDQEYDAVEAFLEPEIRQKTSLSKAEQAIVDKNYAEALGDPDGKIASLVSKGAVPAPRDMIVYRGDTAKGEFSTGDEFMSTTFSKSTADRFANGFDGSLGDAGGKPYLIRAGTPVYAPRSDFLGGEVLVRRSDLDQMGATATPQKLLGGAQPQNDADALLLASTRAPDTSGLDFGDEDLMNFAVPMGERVDADGVRVSQTQSIRDILADLEEDQNFVGELSLCGINPANGNGAAT